jgi:hypothetical protein
MASRSKKVALLFLGLAVALGLGELAALVRFAALELYLTEEFQRRERQQPQLTWWDLTKANEYGFFNGAVYRTNSHGFQGPERTVEKPAGTRRVVLIGDSNVQGSGVPYEVTYAARLETALNADHLGQWEVLNLGVPGFNIEASIERYRRTGGQFVPDLLVYGFTINDVENPYYVASTTCSLDRQWYLVSPSQLLQLVVEIWQPVGEAMWPSPGSYLYELQQNYRQDSPAWHEFTRELDSLAEIATDSQICVVLFFHTQLHMLNVLHPFSRYYDQVTAAARDRGIAVIPSLDAHRGFRDPDLRVGPLDAHPNARGHEVLAGALFSGLQPLLPKCLAKRDAEPSSARR